MSKIKNVSDLKYRVESKTEPKLKQINELTPFPRGGGRGDYSADDVAALVTVLQVLAEAGQDARRGNHRIVAKYERQALSAMKKLSNTQIQGMIYPQVKSILNNTEELGIQIRNMDV